MRSCTDPAHSLPRELANPGSARNLLYPDICMTARLRRQTKEVHHAR